MEPKPFSIKSPEEVASAYGGNKQKIAQAIQMGALDPTSGLLAGMFIDRMRSAQAMEQAPQQTVAQQVLAPSAPPAPPAGLGAIGPQGGGMPAPPPSAPPAGLGAMPPVGMAAGGMTELPTSYGLDSLPIPDSMYDEQSFAGGGIVAFSGGGLQDQIARLEASLENPNLSSAERQSIRNKLSQLVTPSRANPAPSRLADRNMFGEQPRPSLSGNARLGGYTPRVVAPEGFRGLGSSAGSKSDPGIVNMDSYDPNRSSPETQLAAILGGSSTPVATQLGALLGRTETAPLGERGERGAPRGERGIADVAGGAPRATRTGTATPEDDYLAALKPKEVPELGAATEEFKKLFGEIPAPPGTSAEEKAARKNEDLWSSLAQIGFGMAAGESPNFLTNVGKATAAAVPGMQEALKERRADTKEELKQRYAYDLARHGLNKDAVAAAVARTDSLKKDELTKLVTATELQAKAVEGARDRAVQTRGQDITAAGQKITADYYNSLSKKDQRQVEYYANILFKSGQAKTMDEARAMVFYQLNPIPARSSTNVGSLQDRINAFGGRTGGKGGNTPQLPAGYELDE